MPKVAATSNCGFEIDLSSAGEAALESKVAELLTGGSLVLKVEFLDWRGCIRTDAEIAAIGNRFLSA